MNIKSVYIIGSLRNPKIPLLEKDLRAEGFDAFASWFSAGEFADDSWQAYEQGRGLTYEQALRDYSAQHVFNFDKTHINRCDASVLCLPAGKSGHMELGYSIGRGKQGFILIDTPIERWDVMYAFATGVFFNKEDLIYALKQEYETVV